MKIVKRNIRYCEPVAAPDGRLISDFIEVEFDVDLYDEAEISIVALIRAGISLGGLLVIADPAKEPQLSEDEMKQAWASFVMSQILEGEFSPLPYNGDGMETDD